MPTPTPTPNPTPAPTPDCETVPDLVGLTVANARATWTAAGFTGAFGPAFGLNNKIVETQNRSAGACLPATTTISVTYS
jgi:beta-lactam-binding protein with PASTA domain